MDVERGEQREVEWEKLIKENVGPGGLYNLYLVKYNFHSSIH